MALAWAPRPRPGKASAPAAPLTLGPALALGILQGPTELLPVSSSAHTTLIPLLAGWQYAELDPQLRKAFEVALHAGAGIALAVELRGEVAEELRRLDPRRAAVVTLTLAPAVIAGAAFGGPIERLLGGPRSIAAGLVAGSVLMTLAERRRGWGVRTRADVRPLDGLALGIAQACALVPGISRSGATLTAARVRGFSRSEAQALSWHAALPVILGASTLTGARLAARATAPGEGVPLAAGAGAAFASTLVSSRALRRGELGDSLLGFSLYRCLLALAVVRRLARSHNGGR